MLQLKQLLPSNTKRKQRTVKNADVDVNDVLVPPGYRYVMSIQKKKIYVTCKSNPKPLITET